jgi:hypothetical protein
LTIRSAKEKESALAIFTAAFKYSYRSWLEQELERLKGEES